MTGHAKAWRLRWRARCQSGFTGPIIRKLARLAIEAPAHFQHEVLELPRLELEEQEWIELADLVRDKVPGAIYARILAAAERKPARRAPEPCFAPRVINDGPPTFLDGEVDLRVEDEAELNAVPLMKILAARRAGRLSIDDAALLRLAAARVRSDEDWSLGVLDFPEALRDAILEKARFTPHGAERANLLAWLEARGVPRGVLLEVALASMREGEIPYAMLAWLSRQLTTRTAWDRHGFALLSALLARRAFPEISELVTMSWSEAGRTGDDVPRGLLEAIQVAFALALIGVVRAALADGDEPRAMAALSALACLDPPSRVSRAVHELRRHPGMSDELLSLVAVNERLVKHSDARDASLEGVVAALHAIADAFA